MIIQNRSTMNTICFYGKSVDVHEAAVNGWVDNYGERKVF